MGIVQYKVKKSVPVIPLSGNLTVFVVTYYIEILALSEWCLKKKSRMSGENSRERLQLISIIKSVITKKHEESK